MKTSTLAIPELLLIVQGSPAVGASLSAIDLHRQGLRRPAQEPTRRFCREPGLAGENTEGDGPPLAVADLESLLGVGSTEVEQRHRYTQSRRCHQGTRDGRRVLDHR